jgi:CBS domain containing-hemolysin-like protein
MDTRIEDLITVFRQGHAHLAIVVEDPETIV